MTDPRDEQDDLGLDDLDPEAELVALRLAEGSTGSASAVGGPFTRLVGAPDLTHSWPVLCIDSCEMVAHN